MKTFAQFRSNKFPPYDGEEDEINPGLWGRRLAEYLVGKLKEKGISVDEPIAEDWGYYIPVENKDFRLAICCGHQNGDDDEFLCFTDPSKPTVRKLFKKIDASTQLKQITESLNEIFTSDPEITDLEWTEPN